MIKSIPLQPGENLRVTKDEPTRPIIDYIAPNGFVAVVTVIIELFQKFPKGIYVPGQQENQPGGREKL